MSNKKKKQRNLFREYVVDGAKGFLVLIFKYLPYLINLLKWIVIHIVHIEKRINQDFTGHILRFIDQV